MDGQPECYSVDDLLIDVSRGRVTRDGAEIRLVRLTFDLLLTLVQAAPEVLSLDVLMRAVWRESEVGLETVSRRIKCLRFALGDDPKTERYIAGVRGRGYRIAAVVQRHVRLVPISAPARLRAALLWK
jgi:transcriptional activator of cad operon